MASKKSVAAGVLAAVIAASFAFMYGAAKTDSGIMDELAHIPSGYGYVRYLDYRLNPEHPPLLKALSALPLLFLDLDFPTDAASWTTDVNGQWTAGTQFLYESGNDPEQVILWARIAPILFTLLLIAIIYIWSRELIGPHWALLPAFIFALSPTVLAHGHYVTTDVAAALGTVLGTYFFVKYLKTPSRKTLLWAGLAFGIAQLAKFSAVLLIPFFVFLGLLIAAVEVWQRRYGGLHVSWSDLLRGLARRLLGTIGVFLIGYVVLVYPIYALFVVNYPVEKQVEDTKFILSSYAGGPTPEGQWCRPTRCLAETNIWMARHEITRPAAQYMLGVLMVTQRAAGGNTNYFLGNVGNGGSRLYFPVVYLLKEPLPVLAILLIGLLAAAARIFKNVKGRLQSAWRLFVDYLSRHFDEFAMLFFVIFYWLYSIKSPLNIGVRHLMPTFAFMYILATVSWKKWLSPAVTGRSLLETIVKSLKTLFSSALKYAFLAALVVWIFLETALAAPYFLSYFNQLGGGVSHGYRIVTDSNYDWGQDYLRFVEWLKEHPEIDRIAVDYFGAAKTTYYLGERVVPWSSSKGNPADLGIDYFAVSVNNLQGGIHPLLPEQPRGPQDEYRWLTAIHSVPPGKGNIPEPLARIGTSILVYRLR